MTLLNTALRHLARNVSLIIHTSNSIPMKFPIGKGSAKLTCFYETLPDGAIVHLSAVIVL